MKARSGKVRKFAFLDWLLHLTPVQSPLWNFTRFSAANFLHSSSIANLEISAVISEKEKPIRKGERRKNLEVICHSGLNNFCNMIVPLLKSQTHHPACAQAHLYLPHMLLWHNKTLQTPPPVFGRWRGAWARTRWMTFKTVRSCCEKRIETKLCKSR